MKSVLRIVLGLAALVFVLPVAAQDGDVPNKETLILYVAPDTVDCAGVIPQTCLQIRFSPEGEWQRHPENIRNFEHVPGFNYALLVEKIQRNPIAADRASFFYQLISVLEAAPATEDSSYYDLFTPSGEFSLVHIAAETQVCQDGFTPELDCLLLTIGDAEPVPINPARITNFAYVPGSAYTLVVERENLTADNVADVPSFIYQLIHIVSETPTGA